MNEEIRMSSRDNEANPWRRGLLKVMTWVGGARFDKAANPVATGTLISDSALVS
jgi:hypothetical protein